MASRSSRLEVSNTLLQQQIDSMFEAEKVLSINDTWEKLSKVSCAFNIAVLTFILKGEIILIIFSSLPGKTTRCLHYDEDGSP